jgi:integrase
LRKMKVNETDSEVFNSVLNHRKAGNATNHYLRRLQNYAYNMRWLFEPVIPSPQWPKVVRKTTFGISAEEHEQIIASEQNLEHRRYYQMLWETGGSQTDIANLSWDRVEDNKTITFYRAKLANRVEDDIPCGLSQLAIGSNIRAILNAGPQTGYFFPTLRQWSSGHRTTEFARRCRIAGVKNRQLKGYRYAWAERACAAGMPEREAMKHLGHKSPAVHRVYSKKANAITLPLEHYEALKKEKILAFTQVQGLGIGTSFEKAEGTQTVAIHR